MPTSARSTHLGDCRRRGRAGFPLSRRVRSTITLGVTVKGPLVHAFDGHGSVPSLHRRPRMGRSTFRHRRTKPGLARVSSGFAQD